MRHPNSRLIITFLVSLIVGLILSVLFTLFILQVTLRAAGATVWIVAILVAILLIFILDKPLNLRTFEWPESEDEEPPWQKMISHLRQRITQ